MRVHAHQGGGSMPSEQLHAIADSFELPAVLVEAAMALEDERKVETWLPGRPDHTATTEVKPARLLEVGFNDPHQRTVRGLPLGYAVPACENLVSAIEDLRRRDVGELVEQEITDA